MDNREPVYRHHLMESSQRDHCLSVLLHIHIIILGRPTSVERTARLQRRSKGSDTALGRCSSTVKWSEQMISLSDDSSMSLILRAARPAVQPSPHDSLVDVAMNIPWLVTLLLKAVAAVASSPSLPPSGLASRSVLLSL